MIAQGLNDAPKEFKHTANKIVKSSLKQGTKDVKKNLRDIKKRLDNKLINAERKIYAESFIPLVPP